MSINPTPAEKLQNAIHTMTLAMDTCLSNNLIIPGLILFYTSIDMMAYLNMPSHKTDVSRDDFKQWVDTYLLPDTSLKCTSTDLYGARCGLVHTYTAQSRLSRDKKARELFYSSGSDNPQSWANKYIYNDLLGFIIDAEHRNRPPEERPLAVDITELRSALHNAIHKFFADVNHDQQKLLVVLERANKYFHGMFHR